MSPETQITVGMVSTFLVVSLGMWRVFRYIGRLENKIDRNHEDVNRLGNSVRRKDKNLVRHINNHCIYLENIEGFLEQRFDYRSSSATRWPLN